MHRTCFKCARCNHQLSIANYYETESGSYCCDLCPDEEIIQTEVAEANKKIVEAHLESSDEADEVNSLPESQQLQATSSGSNNNNNNEVVVDQDNNLTATKLEEAPEIPTITISEDKDDDEEDIVEENVESEEKSVVEEETKEETDEKQDDECKAPIEDAPLPECDQRDESVDNQDENEEEKSQEDQQVSYPEDLNPFGDAEESEEKLPEDASEDSPQTVEEEKEEIKESSKKESTNPFGSESEEEIEEKPLLQQPPPKPPRLSLNPFGSDFEDDEEEGGVVKPKPRKKRHAPPPPTMTSSPKVTPPPRPPPPFTKSKKDEDNLNRRSQILEEEESITLTPMSPDKSNLDGKWKKKKGPAPPRPIPAKRQVKKLPRKAINSELIDIEIKQTELERQGVDLEKTIRELCEKSDKERAEAGLDNNDRDSLGPEAEDLIVQLFELVNEKNELFRRQTELMYMKREHRLEEEHADIEHQVSHDITLLLFIKILNADLITQIRVLMAKPDALRTDEDKRLEDKLIERLMAIVSQRNEIVDCMEMDRLRELEEDESIEIHLGEYAAIKPPDEDDMAKKKKEKKKKEKKKKKKDKAYDADKDIDTSEYPSGGASLSNSPRPSPKKSPLALNDKEKAKKLKKKLLSSLKPITLKR